MLAEPAAIKIQKSVHDSHNQGLVGRHGLRLRRSGCLYGLEPERLCHLVRKDDRKRTDRHYREQGFVFVEVQAIVVRRWVSPFRPVSSQLRDYSRAESLIVL